ncbi:MAG: hypothetical protein CVV27_19110 [Candidatus Melainabacteria bacterium HGW-Melainabacteria-1]|nr:MAG: hypothetical protein CVV27_19110 [Candidatus Melainabacteria bacterium HGW-Melainabacteria-1]
MRVKHLEAWPWTKHSAVLLCLAISVSLLFHSPSLGTDNDIVVNPDLKQLNKKLNQPPKKEDYRKGGTRDSCLSSQNSELGFDLIFNTKDFFLGGRYEQSLLIKDVMEIHLGFFFYGRPFEKSSFEQTGPTTYNQYKEHRYITGARLTQKMWIEDYFGVFGGVGYGYTFGSFQGTERPARDHWTPHYFGGAILTLGKFLNLTGGYQYTKIPHSPDHFIFTSLSFNLYFIATAGEGADIDQSGESPPGDKPK